MRFLQIQRRAPGWNALRVLFWWNLVRGLLHLSFRVLYGLRADGAGHVPSRGAVIFVSNHQSHLDPMVVGVLVGDRPFAGFARSTLFHPPLFALMMRSIGVVPVRRGKSDTTAMKAALRELAEDRCLAIFPEGTRSRDGAMGEFQKGIALIMKRSDAVVVPLAVEGAFDIWPIGRSRPRLHGRLAVRAGAPMTTEQILADGADVGIEMLRHRIETMRMELRAEMRRRTGGRLPKPGPGDRAYWKRS